MARFIHPMAAARAHRVTIHECQLAVARSYNMNVNYMLQKTRKHHIAHPRQVAMYLCTQLTLASLPDIGRRFGGMDHTTVMYARDKVAAHMREDDAFCAEIEKLATKICEGRAAA